MSSADLYELVPGDESIIVEVDPPESQLYPIQFVRVD